MAGRPIQKKADILAIQKAKDASVFDTRPLIAYVMHNCGCTYAEIGQVFDITRQMAETLVRGIEAKL